MKFTKAERDQHLFNLAKACLKELVVGGNYGMGLLMDEKRPFGNSGATGLDDTLDKAEVPYDESDDADEEGRMDYARQLWEDLPKFIKERCSLTLK